MAAKGSQQSGDRRRSRVGSLLRTATGAVGRVTGASRRSDDADPTDQAQADPAAVKKTAAKKVAAKKTVAKKVAAKKTVAKKVAAKKTVAKKPAAKTASKAATKKVAATKTTGTKPVDEKPAAKKAAGRNSSGAKASAKTSRTTGRTTKATTKAAPTKETTVSTAAAPKTPAAERAARPARKSTAQAAADLVVREDESPWTPEELAEVRAELTADIDRFRAELKVIEADIAGLVHDDNGGAGDDQADVGSKALEREYEYSLANTNRASMEQAVRALARIDDGTYGQCESCGNPIGKLRLQAFPRATLCVQCKQKQERR